MSLSKQHCKPCRGDEEPLSAEEINTYHQQIPKWNIFEKEGIPRLKREFTAKDFVGVIDFVNKIAEIAEEEQHHPNLFIHSYKKLRIEIYTHKTEGLHVNDFILASKIDELYSSLERETIE